MTQIKKMLLVVFATILMIGVFGNNSALADINLDTPTFTVKKVNNGTGIKITVNSVKGADGYLVYIKQVKNDYTSYYYNNHTEIQAANIKSNGKTKQSITIGLTKGTYSVRVRAYALGEKREGSKWRYHDCSDYSPEKKVTIKAAKSVKRVEKEYDFSKVKVGDTVLFGAYEQDDNMTNGPEDIEWIVLSKNSKRVLLLSKYVLDELPYHNEWEPVTWEKCSLRQWLNNEFYKSAFTKKERKMIETVTIENNDRYVEAPTGKGEEKSDYYVKVDGGNNTKDKVFLLSIEEASNKKYGFISDEESEDISRRCSPTLYAKVRGTTSMDDDIWEVDWESFLTREGNPSCYWGLRSSGLANYDRAVVYCRGNISDNDVDKKYGIRPAIYIKL